MIFRSLKKSAVAWAGLVALIVALLVLPMPSAEQQIVSQAGPVIVLGTSMSDRSSYSFLVGVQPFHQYGVVVISRGPGNLSNVFNNIAAAAQWSADPPGQTGQTFVNVSSFFHLYDSASGGNGNIGNCLTTAVALGTGQFELCVLPSLPARTIKLVPQVLNGGNSYDLEVVDITTQGGNVFANAPPNSSQAIGGTTNVTNTPSILIVGGSDNTATARAFKTDSAGDQLLSTQNAIDHAQLSVTTPQSLTPAGSASLVVLPTLEYRVPGDAAMSVNWLRGVSKFTSAAATAAGNTAVWTPAAGTKFRLECVGIDVTQNAAAAAAGVVTIQLEDNASAIPGFQWSVFVPNAAGTTFGAGYHEPLECFANGFLSSTSGNVLNVNLSAALTAGNVTVRAYGTDE